MTVPVTTVGIVRMKRVVVMVVVMVMLLMMKMTCHCTHIYATLPADTPMIDEEEIIIQIQQGLPDHIRAILNDHCTEFQTPPFSSLMAELIISEAIDFKGDRLIDIRDLKGLEGKAAADESKWVTNFIVDAYLQLVKAESAQKGVKVEIF